MTNWGFSDAKPMLSYRKKTAENSNWYPRNAFGYIPKCQPFTRVQPTTQDLFHGLPNTLAPTQLIRRSRMPRLQTIRHRHPVRPIQLYLEDLRDCRNLGRATLLESSLPTLVNQRHMKKHRHPQIWLNGIWQWSWRWTPFGQTRLGIWSNY